MDEIDDAMPTVLSDDAEMRQILGVFDIPAFARRGVELEHALKRLQERLERERSGLLEMVRLRLRQWSQVATGPDDWPGVFVSTVAPLYAASRVEAPVWGSTAGSTRRRQSVARDLVASITRFNTRWRQFLDSIKLDAVNRQIDQYNRYYVLEKECVIGSTRLAMRHFVPKPLVTLESLIDAHPMLEVPGALTPTSQNRRSEIAS